LSCRICVIRKSTSIRSPTRTNAYLTLFRLSFILIGIAGNCMFRDLIANNVQRYVQADSKTSRGEIISDILRQIQSKSPSHTGFLKLDPETARWVSIGSNKAKDKVGHALRKAVMSVQGGHDGDKNQRSSGTKPVAKDSSNLDASPPTKSNKRKASEPVSILKRGREAKYESSALDVDTTNLAGPPSEERTPLTRFFSSLGAHTTILRSPMAPAGSPPFGLSPVARNIFDDKDDALSPLYGRRSRRGNASSMSSFFASDTDHAQPSQESSASSSSKEDHGTTELHGYVNQSQAPADYPNGAPINGPMPPFIVPGAYFPLGPSSVWPHPPPPVYHPGTSVSGGAPPEVPTAPFPPPPPSSAVPYYYPPGFYYYPGYGMPMAPSPAVHSSQAPPPSFPFLPRTDASSVTYQQDVSFPSQHFTQPMPYEDSSNKYVSSSSYPMQQDDRKHDDDSEDDHEKGQV